jgi:hypothetical protein
MIKQTFTIVIDVGVGRIIEEWLSQQGYNVITISNVVAEEKLSSIQNIFPNYLAQIKNHFSVYQNGKLRIRNYTNE